MSERFHLGIKGDGQNFAESSQFVHNASGQFNRLRVEVSEEALNVYAVAIQQSVELSAWTSVELKNDAHQVIVLGASRLRASHFSAQVGRNLVASAEAPGIGAVARLGAGSVNHENPEAHCEE